MRHWSFSGLEGLLGSEEGRRAFFKPTKGCSCVFGTEGKDGEQKGANVRVCAEITPMGVSDYIPKDWDVVENLEPAEFHARLCSADLDGDGGGRYKGDMVLVDVRNHYESRIGYFVNPSTGEPALRPGIRRFGQWPQFVKTHLSNPSKDAQPPPDGHPASFENGTTEEVNINIKAKKGTQYMTYCTGGIRCEKGSRFLAEKLVLGGERASVCTLQGGIQAYLMWMDSEIKAGRKTAQESLFKGRNYVFDARGSTGLALSSSEMGEEGEGEKVATCNICAKPDDRLSKCRSKGCHLILVVCEECEVGGDVRCCGSCLELDTQAAAKDVEEKAVGEEKVPGKARPRSICDCERERETKLWGDKRAVKSQRQNPQGKRKGKGKDYGTEIRDDSNISIRIKTID